MRVPAGRLHWSHRQRRRNTSCVIRLLIPLRGAIVPVSNHLFARAVTCFTAAARTAAATTVLHVALRAAVRRSSALFTVPNITGSTYVPVVRFRRARAFVSRLVRSVVRRQNKCFFNSFAFPSASLFGLSIPFSPPDVISCSCIVVSSCETFTECRCGRLHRRLCMGPESR